ncbi:MBL fold metallo-hydrolase [Sinosporangium siamense]|nr:MBL fold metallo-hydrolase [Sinosporangium siamense]
MPVGHVYFKRLADGYAVVDTGVPGSAIAVLDALTQLDAGPEDLRQIVLTHSHIDHAGAAADLVAVTGARVFAGVLDAPVIRGDVPEPTPAYTPAEDELHRRITEGWAKADSPPLKYVPVDVELHDGDSLDGWGEPVHVVHVPGHTLGSIALHLPGSALLFPGDIIATAEGRAILGPFNIDRDHAVASFRRLVDLDPEIVCVPHGDPITSDASAVLRAATPESDWL